MWLTVFFIRTMHCQMTFLKHFHYYVPHYGINFPTYLLTFILVVLFSIWHMRWNYIIYMKFVFFFKWLHSTCTLKNNFSGMNNFYGTLNLLKILCMFYYMLDICPFTLFSYINSPNAEVLQCLLESRASSPFETCFDGLRDTDWLNRPRRNMTGYSI